jgi:AcrR family transcriptional regulator
MATDAPARSSARERLLAAADELFYAEGVHTVGIDRIIERAGVAKASLYSTFGSKDGLIRAYLEGRQDERTERITRGLTRFHAPRERLLGVFDVLADATRTPTFRGCAFINASGESPRGGVVEDVADSSRAWIRELFIRLAGDAGARDPDQLGRQLAMLYDGATVAATMDRNPKAAALARAAAEVLLDAAITAPAAARRSRKALAKR